MKTQLLCTFSSKSELDGTIQKIKNSYDIAFKKIYVFQNEDNVKELICTYNVDLEKGGVDYNAVENTISLHRKKHSNKNLNNGALDSKFTIPWENFKNTLLVTNNDGLNRISTRIYKIIQID